MIDEVECRQVDGIAAVSRLSVHLTESETRSFLSSQIYSFMAARTSSSPRQTSAKSGPPQAQMGVPHDAVPGSNDIEGARGEELSASAPPGSVVAGDVLQALKDLMQHAQVSIVVNTGELLVIVWCRFRWIWMRSRLCPTTCISREIFILPHKRLPNSKARMSYFKTR